MLSAEVSANTYLLPPTQGLTAGATADEPDAAPAPPRPAPAPEPTAPATTTTAAISGATR